MKKRKFLVKSIARNVRVMNEDLRKDYIINPSAERELSTLERKVSPQLYGMLVQHLLGFHADMQYEMAINLVVFACRHSSTVCWFSTCLGSMPTCSMRWRSIWWCSRMSTSHTLQAVRV